MVCLVFSSKDPISAGIAEHVRKLLDLEEKGDVSGHVFFSNGSTDMLRFDSPLIHLEHLDALMSSDVFIFLSKHVSASGKMSFTLHSEGNWSDEAIAGGKPKELSVSSPDSLQGLLKSVKKNNDTDIPVVYEATHHGPLLETPSLFFEFGGGATENQKPYEIMAKALSDWLEEPPDSCEKIAFGIGGGHYPEKFTKLSLESKYSFSHIMPKYHADVDMVKKGLSRASAPAECALIDWKGIKSAERDAIVKRLEELGIDHVRL